MNLRKTLFAFSKWGQAKESRPAAPAPSHTASSRPLARWFYVKTYPLNPWHTGGYWEDESECPVSPYFADLEQAMAWRLTYFSHNHK
jgi:hypothetical protein